MCTAGRVELLPVFANNLGEDAHVGAEEGEALHPDEGEGVVALELQEVGRQQPRALHRKKTHYKEALTVFRHNRSRDGSVSFWASRIRISNYLYGYGSGSESGSGNRPFINKQKKNKENLDFNFF
jgi:hypothetical protein